FRQARPTGPPSPGGAARDREGLRGAVQSMRALVSGRVFLGGHSYGGRQASILAADQPGLADAILLLSYPLHPPGRAAQLRTAHFGNLRTPALFVQGSVDPFGSLDELESARGLIPARTALLAVDGAGHALLRGRRPDGGGRSRASSACPRGSPGGAAPRSATEATRTTPSRCPRRRGRRRGPGPGCR